MKTILYTGGTFDIPHIGHFTFLKRCKEIADFVVVALNTDEFCSQYKRKPIMTYEERKATLKSIPYVDSVIKNTGGYDSKPAILNVMPDYIVHGDDWTGAKYLKQLAIDRTFLKKHKIKLLYVPYTKGISTSEIIKRIKQSK
jgi:glycerol-3-phosphate cytidylyltransferase